MEGGREGGKGHGKEEGSKEGRKEGSLPLSLWDQGTRERMTERY